MTLEPGGGVILVITKARKIRCRNSWITIGMCFRTRYCNPSGPAALWIRVRRTASCNIAGLICPDIFGTEELGVGWTRPSQGNATLGGNVGSGERATVLFP